MDREIPIRQQRRTTMRRVGKSAAIVGLLAVAVAVTVALLRDDVRASDISVARAERGQIESSVAASGRIVPLYEQAVVSPVATRILEVYCSEGDSVEAGQSLLRLDLMTAETDCQRLTDEVSMKRNEIEQASLNNATFLTDLEMRIKVKAMSLSHLQAEVANERRLDSIGSGTGDRIRQAELACSTAKLELEQLRAQLANERRAHAASLRSKQLEGSVTERNLQTMWRTLDDARVRSPRRGTVTWLNKSLGTSIAAGEKLAVVSDLGHFKIEGEIPENISGKLSVGSEVNVRINRNTVRGRIATISPQSTDGMVRFTVFLDDDSGRLLRSGLRTDLNVVYDVHDGVTRIPNGPYFQGPGTYTLFVRTAPDRLESRTVTLGDSNFDFVEVTSGLEPGDDVVVSDMSRYNNRKSLTIKE